MLVTVNSKQHHIPFDLADITLGKYLEYYEKYGKQLDLELAELRKKDYRKHLESLGAFDITADDIELHQGLDIDDHLDQEALSWFSFWTETDLFIAKQQPEVITM